METIVANNICPSLISTAFTYEIRDMTKADVFKTKIINNLSS